MRSTAQVRAAQLLPEGPRRLLAQAEQQWAKAQAEGSHAALVDRARQLETAFVEALRATHTAGRAIGRRTAKESFSPSAELVAFIRENRLFGQW